MGKSELEDLEDGYNEIIIPRNLLEGVNGDELKKWLYTDRYGNRVVLPDEKDMLSFLEVINSDPDFEEIEVAVLRELVKLKNVNRYTARSVEVDERY